MIRKILKIETITLYSDALQKLIANTECEIVHCHDVMSAWAALRARSIHNKRYKVVVTVHGPTSRHMIEEGQAINSPDVLMVERCEKETWRECDAIIAVDKTQAEIVIEQGGDDRKITVIPNAVNIDELVHIANTLPILNKSKRKWLFVPRRLTPKNGIEYAIKALPLLKNRPLLLLAGSGIEKENLEKLVASLDLKNDVVFLGSLNHEIMLPLLNASDVVLIPSVPIHGIVEATSIAAIEAMALGKAIVASGIGGLNELIVNEESGLLVSPCDPNELALAIDSILSNSTFSETLQEGASNNVKNNFNDELWINKHIQIYTNLKQQPHF